MEVVVAGTMSQRESMEVAGGVHIVLALVLPIVVSVLKISMNEIIGGVMIDFPHLLVYEDPLHHWIHTGKVVHSTINK